MKSSLIFIPSFSLTPNKMVAYNSVFKRDYENELIVPIQSKKKLDFFKTYNESKNQIIKRTSHNLEISTNAYRNLKNKINWLYYLAKSKKVKTYNGKTIFNFKMCFITLTLPSKQITPTIEVTKNLLNPFLTEIRQRTEMSNYVWRLEFQKNGNVHYHLVTDTYLDYYFVKQIWNRLLASNGYIAPYQEKWAKLSLLEYNNKVNPYHKIEFSVIKKRYFRARQENWSNPNSIDVRSVISSQSIASYISKYFGKAGDPQFCSSEYDTLNNTANLRLWFCSRSISSLKSISGFCETFKVDIYSLIKSIKNVKIIVTKYATIYFFNVKLITGFIRQTLEILYRTYSRQQGYIPA